MVHKYMYMYMYIIRVRHSILTSKGCMALLNVVRVLCDHVLLLRMYLNPFMFIHKHTLLEYLWPIDKHVQVCALFPIHTKLLTSWNSLWCAECPYFTYGTLNQLQPSKRELQQYNVHMYKTYLAANSL